VAGTATLGADTARSGSNASSKREMRELIQGRHVALIKPPISCSDEEEPTTTS
jgi:hypothetical protein